MPLVNASWICQARAMIGRWLAMLLVLGGCEACGADRTSHDAGKPIPTHDSAQTGDTAHTSEPEEPRPACNFVESDYGPAGAVRITVDVVAKGLEVPWGIAFLDRSTMLVTERPGRVVTVKTSGEVSPPIARPEVAPTGEAGLLGIALDPAFADN